MSTPTITLSRRAALTALVGIGWIIATRDRSADIAQRTPGTPLPLLPLLDRDGQPAGMPWLAGTACVLAVWTSWCPTCQAAMPFWERNAAAFAAQGVRVYAINHRESLATIDTASRDFPAALTVLADPDGALLSTLHSTDLPTTAFVDRRGHVTAVIRGPVSANTAQTLLSALVAPQAETP